MILKEYYDNDYVRHNSYEEGIGKLFISTSQNFVSVEREDYVNFEHANKNTNFGYIEVVRPIIQLQMELLTRLPRNLKNLTLSQKRDDIKFRKLILESLEETIAQFRY